jgi:GT2 family glycosyltransferase
MKNIITVGTIGIMGGVPELPTPFVESFVNMINYTNEYLLGVNEQIKIEFATMSYHSSARNHLAYNLQGDWLLMLDTDQTFEPDLLTRLKWVMDKYQVNVLTGLYYKKYPPYDPVIYQDKGDWKLENLIEYDTSKEIIEIDSAGGGCLLVKSKVYNELINKFDELPFNEIPKNSEDHSFFWRLKQLGIKAFCAPHIQTNHLEWREVTEEVRKQWLNQSGKDY